MGRPEAGCWSHGELSRCSAGARGCVGAAWAVGGGRWADAARAPGLRHWPFTEDVSNEPSTGIQYDRLKQALDNAFAERDGEDRIHTRAIVVIHKGQLVAERYADGSDQHMPPPGPSTDDSFDGLVTPSHL